VDAHRPLRHAAVSARRKHVLLQPVLRQGDESAAEAFAPITPAFLIPPLVPLYVAWFFFMVRFYLLPWLLGYSVMGMLSFPLESEFAHGVAYLIGLIFNR
jgi:hypothetical protein